MDAVHGDLNAVNRQRIEGALGREDSTLPAGGSVIQRKSMLQTKPSGVGWICVQHGFVHGFGPRGTGRV